MYLYKNILNLTFFSLFGKTNSCVGKGKFHFSISYFKGKKTGGNLLFHIITCRISACTTYGI